MKCWFINITFEPLTHWANETDSLTSISFPLRKEAAFLKDWLAITELDQGKLRDDIPILWKQNLALRCMQLHNWLCLLLCFYDQTYYVSMNSLLIIYIISWQLNKKVIIGILFMQMNRLRLRKRSYCLPNITSCLSFPELLCADLCLSWSCASFFRLILPQGMSPLYTNSTTPQVKVLPL